MFRTGCNSRPDIHCLRESAAAGQKRQDDSDQSEDCFLAHYALATNIGPDIVQDSSDGLNIASAVSVDAYSQRRFGGNRPPDVRVRDVEVMYAFWKTNHQFLVLCRLRRCLQHIVF